MTTEDIKDVKVKKIVEDIIQEEDREQGSVSIKVYLSYLRLTGGFSMFFILMIMFTCWAFIDFGFLWFLQEWNQLPEKQQADTMAFVTLFGSISFLITFLALARTFIIFKNNIQLSYELNFMMSFRLIHASMNQFFDRVPMGRILNRFLKDGSNVDTMIPWRILYFFFAFFSVGKSLIVSAQTSSEILYVIIFFYLIISFKIQRYYANLFGEIVRLKGITSSPLVQCFSETLSGISMIRVHGKFDKQISAYHVYQDEWFKNAMILSAARGWFNLRISMLSLCISIPAICISIFWLETPVGIFALMLDSLLKLTG